MLSQYSGWRANIYHKHWPSTRGATPCHHGFLIDKRRLAHNKLVEGLAFLAGIVCPWGMQAQEASTTVPDLKRVVVRLAQPYERPRWDALMDQQHCLGFQQFAERGLRDVAECDGQGLALLG